MDDSLNPFQSDAIPIESGGLGVPSSWVAVEDDGPRHIVISGTIRSREELPVFCNPVALFVAIWVMMLACLSVHVSYVTYPYLGTPLLIFAVSTASLTLGYFASKAVLDDVPESGAAANYLLDVTTLWRLNLLFCAGAVSLIVLNWMTSGPPPALGDATTYLTYGRFKQVLFPLLTTVAVNATLDTSRTRRYLFLAFSLSVLAVYVARGVLLITFIQMFFLVSLKSRMGKRRQYTLALGAFAVAIAGVTIFGNLRTAHEVFIDFLEIRTMYADWPTAFLWFVSYISIPFSNLCWMVVHGSSHGPTLSFLYSLLPSFMTPNDPYADVLGSLNIIDGASTYLQGWALDFSYLGIYFANLLIGLGCGWLAMRAYPKHLLILAIFLASISLLFFSDFFFLLSIVVQVAFQAFVEKRCLQWQEPGGTDADEFA